jgi:hypothetical protein
VIAALCRKRLWGLSPVKTTGYKNLPVRVIFMGNLWIGLLAIMLEMAIGYMVSWAHLDIEAT